MISRWNCQKIQFRSWMEEVGYGFFSGIRRKSRVFDSCSMKVIFGEHSWDSIHLSSALEKAGHKHEEAITIQITMNDTFLYNSIPFVLFETIFWHDYHSFLSICIRYQTVFQMSQYFGNCRRRRHAIWGFRRFLVPFFKMQSSSDKKSH